MSRVFWILELVVALLVVPLDAATVKLKSGRTITNVAKAEKLANGQMRIEQRDGFVLYMDAQQVVEVVPDDQDQEQPAPQLRTAGPADDEEAERAARREAFRRDIATKHAETEANYRRMQKQNPAPEAETETAKPAPKTPQLRLIHGVVQEILGPTTVKVSRLDRPVRIAGLAAPDPSSARDRLGWELSNDVVYVLYDPEAAAGELEAMLYDETGHPLAPFLVKTGFFRVDPQAQVSFPTQLSKEAMQRVEREGPIAYP